MAKPLPRREAYVHRESWAGRTKEPVYVIGETPKRYVVEGKPGRGAWLVPKYAVEFVEWSKRQEPGLQSPR